MAFTAAELEEMRRADEEIEADFRFTQEELERARDLDRVAAMESMDKKKQRAAARYKAYYNANREKELARFKAYYNANRERILKRKKAYREANKERVTEQKKAYLEANREKYNAYARAYQARRRQAKKEADL